MSILGATSIQLLLVGNTPEVAVPASDCCCLLTKAYPLAGPLGLLPFGVGMVGWFFYQR